MHEGYMEMSKVTSELFLIHKSIIFSKATSEINLEIYSMIKNKEKRGNIEINKEELSMLEKNIDREKKNIKIKEPILKEKYDILINKYYTWSVFLSKEFNENFLDFNSEFMNFIEYTKVTADKENSRYFDSTIYSDYLNSYIKLLRSARKSLGVEPLNGESYKIINNMLKNRNNIFAKKKMSE